MNLVKQAQKLITTFFYTGYCPFIPGTVGSLVGLFLYLALRNTLPALFFIYFFILLSGFMFSGKTALLFHRMDPPQIVIDEVNGIFLCFLFLPLSASNSLSQRTVFIIGFIAFRILDMIKPWPANRIQRLKGSLGIMGDDIIAAVYTYIILRIILCF